MREHEHVIKPVLYVEVRLGQRLLQDFFRWQSDEKLYAVRLFTSGGPDGYFNAAFENKDAVKVAAWLNDHGILDLHGPSMLCAGLDWHLQVSNELKIVQAERDDLRKKLAEAEDRAEGLQRSLQIERRWHEEARAKLQEVVNAWVPSAKDQKFFWLAERPTVPLYRSLHPLETCGDVADVERARKFTSKVECEDWIEANAQGLYVAREHAIMTGPT